MPLRAVLLLMLVPLAGCARFTASQEVLIEDAIQLSNVTVADSLYGAIVLLMAEAGEIAWGRQRIGRMPRRARTQPTRWLLEQIQTNGVVDADDLQAWKKHAPIAALTSPCEPTTQLNMLQLDRDVFALAGTLVHERTHALCVTHPRSQKRLDNLCDPAYVFGDLTETLARHRDADARLRVLRPLCPALCQRLYDADVVFACTPPK
ncbi:MAG: hypothetical protein AAF730_08360 [Bacteroidota bacterium]